MKILFLLALLAGCGSDVKPAGITVTGAGQVIKNKTATTFESADSGSDNEGEK